MEITIKRVKELQAEAPDTEITCVGIAYDKISHIEIPVRQLYVTSNNRIWANLDESIRGYDTVFLYENEGEFEKDRTRLVKIVVDNIEEYIKELREDIFDSQNEIVKFENNRYKIHESKKA